MRWLVLPHAAVAFGININNIDSITGGNTNAVDTILMAVQITFPIGIDGNVAFTAQPVDI